VTLAAASIRLAPIRGRCGAHARAESRRRAGAVPEEADLRDRQYNYATPMAVAGYRHRDLPDDVREVFPAEADPDVTSRSGIGPQDSP